MKHFVKTGTEVTKSPHPPHHPEKETIICCILSNILIEWSQNWIELPVAAQKFLNIMNDAIGYFEVARWVNVLSQNGQFRGSDHLFLGYAKMIGQDPPPPTPHIAILYNTVDPDYVQTTPDEFSTGGKFVPLGVAFTQSRLDRMEI